MTLLMKLLIVKVIKWMLHSNVHTLFCACMSLCCGTFYNDYIKFKERETAPCVFVC